MKGSITDIQEHKLNQPSNSRGRTGHIPEEICQTGITSNGKA